MTPCAGEQPRRSCERLRPAVKPTVWTEANRTYGVRSLGVSGPSIAVVSAPNSRSSKGENGRSENA